VGGPRAPESRVAPSSAPPPSGWTPIPPAPEPETSTTAPSPSPSWPHQLALQSAATLPPGIPSPLPALKHKPDPATRPLTEYSLGDGVSSETLEGARLSSKPPRK
jgi:hypothetical protein